MTVTPYMTMSAKPPSTKLCFCISNRTASLILGYITLVYHAAIAFFVAAALVWIWVETNGFDGIRTTEWTSKEYHEREFQKYIIAHYAAVLIFILLLNVFSFTLNVICLVGIHKRRPNMMHWHLSFGTARMLIVISSMAYNMIAGYDMGILFLQIFDIVLTANCLSVICSYIRLLKREEAENMRNEKNGEIFKIPIA